MSPVASTSMVQPQRLSNQDLSELPSQEIQEQAALKNIIEIAQSLLKTDLYTPRARRNLNTLFELAKTLKLNQESPENLFPPETILNILKFLDFEDFTKTHAVCKRWKKLSDIVFLEKFRFGKEKWEQYFGLVGKEPPLPSSIREILTSPCPFWKNKKVYQTHILTLIPKTVDGNPLTLDLLNQKGHEMVEASEQITSVEIDSSHWVLMTKKMIPNSMNKSYKEQMNFMSQYADKGYELPHVLGTTISILVEYAHTGRKLYAKNPNYNYLNFDLPCSFTISQDIDKKSHFIIGAFGANNSDKLYITTNPDAEEYGISTLGIAGYRKF